MSHESESNRLLDDRLLLQLERLALSAKAQVSGSVQGSRRSRQLGTSQEFADYRLYSPGDDFRQLDWNVYGRTGKPFIKLFEDELELQVNLYIDASRSMDFGAIAGGPQQSKFRVAKQLAACIGYIALLGYDRVSTAFYSDQVHERLPAIRGRGAAPRLFQFLADARPQQQGDLAAALMHPLALPKRKGVTWIFSDFLYASGVKETLSYMRASGQELVVVQILSPEEYRPKLSGDLRLIDSESGTGKEVAMSAKVLKAYESELALFTDQLQKFCYEHQIAYMLTSTDQAIQNTIFQLFYRGGVLQ